jgi:hypothetical protein
MKMKNTTSRNVARVMNGGAVAVAMLAGLALSNAAALASLPGAASGVVTGVLAAASDEGSDVLIFKDGTVRTGKIESETPTKVKFSGKVGTIPFTTEYNKSDILEIKRAAKGAEAKPAAKAGAASGADAGKNATPAAAPVAAPSESEDRKTYYYVDVKGKFGEEISQSPFARMLKDAQKTNPDLDYLIIRLESERWADPLKLEKIPDTASDVRGVMRAEPITKLLVNQLPADWPNHPQVVFWVKDAFAGAAFIPLSVPTIYFTSDGKMGGLGNLQMLYGSTGDKVVRDKLRSATEGHALGWAHAGGYPLQVVRAMASITYVLSYRMDGDQPVFFERMPENPGEWLLTDDGNLEEGRRDLLEDAVRGRGNDVLTLDATLAERLKISKGTVDTFDQLLFKLGLDRAGVAMNGRGQRIFDDWSDGLVRARREILRLLRDFQEVRVEGETPRQRNAARGRQMKILDEVASLIKQYGEGLEEWMYENDIPPETILRERQEVIRIEIMKDNGR